MENKGIVMNKNTKGYYQHSHLLCAQNARIDVSFDSFVGCYTYVYQTYSN